MKSKLVKYLITSLSLVSVLISCHDPKLDLIGVETLEALKSKYGYDFYNESPLKNEFFKGATNKGRVESLTYKTHSYALEAALNKKDIYLTKKLNVYLPFNYSNENKYNVLYLLHGTSGWGDPKDMADYWFSGSNYNRNITLSILDHVFETKKNKEFIVVSATYYSRVKGYNPTKEDYEALIKKLDDSVSLWENDPEQTLWTRFFGDELVNDIIPLVETKYSTYLTSATKEGIVKSRDHRAYAGLSRGSMTSVNSIMMNHLDAFSYIGSYSGIWADFDKFKSVLNNKWPSYEVKYWYNGNGTRDFSLEDHVTFKDKVLNEFNDKFIDGNNYAWVNVKKGDHDYNNWVVHLYNSLLCFFTK